jgi:PGF-CTERM protein
MIKELTSLAAFFLIVLAVIFPVSVSATDDPSGTGSDASVTITPLGQTKYFIWDDTVTFSGTNTASDTTYLFINGPSLNMKGAQIQSLHPAQSPVIDGDASTFLAVRTGPDHRWSYTWDTHDVMIDSGTYTLTAASAPRDLPHVNSTHSARVSFIMAPPKSIVRPADTDTSAGPGNGLTIAGKGVVTIMAAGSQAYDLGDEIRFSGTNTETYRTYLFLSGPNLPENGAYIANPDPRHWPSKDQNVSTFKSIDVNGDRTWSWRWGTADYALDAGTYTVYAVSRPLTKASLEQAAYGTVTIIIRRPSGSSASPPATPVAAPQAAPAANPAPTKSPGCGAVVALAGLGAGTFLAVRRY